MLVNVSMETACSFCCEFAKYINLDPQTHNGEYLYEHVTFYHSTKPLWKRGLSFSMEAE